MDGQSRIFWSHFVDIPNGNGSFVVDSRSLVGLTSILSGYDRRDDFKAHNNLYKLTLQ